MVYIVGGVLSHNPALATMNQLLGGIVFHAVLMIGGMSCVLKAAAAREAAAKHPETV